MSIMCCNAIAELVFVYHRDTLTYILLSNITFPKAIYLEGRRYVIHVLYNAIVKLVFMDHSDALPTFY